MRKSAFFQDFCRSDKCIADLFRPVGITSYGDDIASHSSVTLQDGKAGIWLGQTIFQASGIELQTFPQLQQQFQYGVEYIPVSVISIVFILAGPIADDIVQMAVYIEIVKTADIFQYVLEIFPIGFLFRPLCM